MVILMAGAAVFAVVTLSCDPGISVTFENQTTEDIRVSVKKPDSPPGFDNVAAGHTRTLEYFSRNRDEFRVVIVDFEDRTLLDDTYTRDDLESFDWRFVIDDSGVQPAGR
jgi:hypothetical protein